MRREFTAVAGTAAPVAGATACGTDGGSAGEDGTAPSRPSPEDRTHDRAHPGASLGTPPGHAPRRGATSLFAVPVWLPFLFPQRRAVGGLTAGAVKG